MRRKESIVSKKRAVYGVRRCVSFRFVGSLRAGGTQVSRLSVLPDGSCPLQDVVSDLETDKGGSAGEHFACPWMQGQAFFIY